MIPDHIKASLTADLKQRATLIEVATTLSNANLAKKYGLTENDVHKYSSKQGKLLKLHLEKARA